MVERTQRSGGRRIDTDPARPIVWKNRSIVPVGRTLPMPKYVYFFGSGKAEGSSLMRNLLGGKGCEIAEMTNLGIPVPPGFTITTEAWAHYNQSRQWPDGLEEQVRESIARLEQVAGATLGDPKRPLLVSVRSGARTSMPGMMETVLN